MVNGIGWLAGLPACLDMTFLLVSWFKFVAVALEAESTPLVLPPPRRLLSGLPAEIRQAGSSLSESISTMSRRWSSDDADDDEAVDGAGELALLAPVSD